MFSKNRLKGIIELGYCLIDTGTLVYNMPRQTRQIFVDVLPFFRRHGPELINGKNVVNFLPWKQRCNAGGLLGKAVVEPDDNCQVIGTA